MFFIVYKTFNNILVTNLLKNRLNGHKNQRCFGQPCLASLNQSKALGLDRIIYKQSDYHRAGVSLGKIRCIVSDCELDRKIQDVPDPLMGNLRYKTGCRIRLEKGDVQDIGGRREEESHPIADRSDKNTGLLFRAAASGKAETFRLRTVRTCT